jgi:glucose/arabinose dehydrogenase
VFTPGIAPVFLEYYSGEPPIFPEEYAGRFFVALGGSDQPPLKPQGILSFGYDVAAGWVTSPPEDFLRYTGEGFQKVVGVAVGPDGLYYTSLFPWRMARCLR